ncbi:hypothetical protein KQI52_04385 [bacterium]|nr:hypothetical protein [bacterium]
MDLFVDELADYVVIVEIKGTNWDQIKPKNVKKLLGAHRRQVWRYIDEFVDGEVFTSVCAGMIYPTAPDTPGLKEQIEEYLNEWALQVVWFDDP